MQPVAFELFGFAIRYYSLMYMLAALAAFVLIHRIARERQLPVDSEVIADIVTFGMIGGILGGRIYYVLFNWDLYRHQPLEILAIWHGGLAIHGGMIGGALAVLWYARRHRLPIADLADGAALSLILGQTLGRLGNFMNGDAHGVPTDSPLGLIFPPGSIAGSQYPGTPVHPVMLYEMGLNFLAFLLLYGLRQRLRPGALMGLYLIFYGCIRTFTSTFRADSLWLGPVKAAYVASALMILAGIGLLWELRRKSP